VAGLGWFLYQGVVDPLGGINTLWPIFALPNQLLAVIAFSLGTTVLLKKHRLRYIWVNRAAHGFLLIVTMTAGWQKIFDPAAGDLFRPSANCNSHWTRRRCRRGRDQGATV